jgi:hypothetical protein
VKHDANACIRRFVHSVCGHKNSLREPAGGDAPAFSKSLAIHERFCIAPPLARMRANAKKSNEIVG